MRRSCCRRESNLFVPCFDRVMPTSTLHARVCVPAELQPVEKRTVRYRLFHRIRDAVPFNGKRRGNCLRFFLVMREMHSGRVSPATPERMLPCRFGVAQPRYPSREFMTHCTVHPRMRRPQICYKILFLCQRWLSWYQGRGNNC